MPGLVCIRDMDGDSKAFAAMDMSFSTPSAAGHEVGTMHGLINYIDTKAKCRHLKKIDL